MPGESTVNERPCGLNIQDSRWGYWSPTLRRFLALQGAALIVAGIAVLLMDGPVGPRLAVSLMMVFSGVGACWVVYVVSNDMHLTDERIRSAHRKLDQTNEIQAVAIEGVDIDLEPQESHPLDPAQRTRNLWARLTAAATLFSRIRHVRRRGALATELADLPEGNLSGPKRN